MSTQGSMPFYSRADSSRSGTINSVIEEKVRQAIRLSEEEALYLLTQSDFMHLGQLANQVREQHHGRQTYYNINHHLNPTNICIMHCSFCAFSKSPGDKKGYVLSPEDACNQLTPFKNSGITEIHIVGGCHPDLGLEYYKDLYRTVLAVLPGVHIKSLTAVEIVYLAEKENLSIKSILRQLQEAGLGSLPGGGAEIFSARVRKQLCPNKCDADTWLSVHRCAHQLRLRSNATLLFGHIETPEEIIDHLARLRSLQDATGGFMAFIPLVFHPENNQLGNHCHLTGIDILKVLAVSRLFLDNFDHIKAYWVTLGLDLAQMALWFGADDLDGTVLGEQIHHEAGSGAPLELHVSELQTLIRNAGRIPIERNSLYQIS
jgi:aminodeoxyfutalosine synthase